MVGLTITVSLLVAVPLALPGAGWIYRDATTRRVDTADTWAVGFSVAYSVPQIVGGVVAFAIFLGKRHRRGGGAVTVPAE